MFIFNIIIFYFSVEIYKSETILREDPFDDEGVFHNKVESEQ